ncbi:hypothetical protein BC832DRAFT_592011 [Gaertneriomyces semiglobifer]|nr:hypothetical protein BC832DRAFT_592011 [Gaertneriomyces semiglobifer]
MRLAFSIALVGISLGADFANGQPVQETNPTSLLPLPPIPCVPPLPGTSEPDVCKVFNPAAVCGSYVCQLPVPTVSVPYDAADDPRHEGGNKYFDFRSSTVFIPCYENRTYSAPYVDMASYAWCPTVDEYRHPPDYVVPPSVCVKRIPEHGLCLSTADDHWILPNGMVADIEYFPSLLYNNPCENPSQVACDTTTQKCAPLNRRTEGPSKNASIMGLVSPACLTQGLNVIRTATAPMIQIRSALRPNAVD